MDRLAAMQLFVRVVESGSFAAAATQADISRAQASKLIRALEDDLGVRLLQRTTRKLSLTEAGQRYLDRVREALAAINEAEAEAAEHQSEPRGRLRLSAPMSFSILHLGPALAEFHLRYPKIELEVDLDDRLVDLVEDGWDIALRIGRLADSSLVARRIAPCRMVAVASPGYLQRQGTPQHPLELARHACLRYSLARRRDEWTFTRTGESVTIVASGPLRANNGDMIAAAATAGLGIALQPSFISSERLRRGELVRVLPDWQIEADAAVYAVYPASRALPAKTRALIDFLAERFGDFPYWDCGLFPETTAPTATRKSRSRS